MTRLFDCKNRQLALGRRVVVFWEMFSSSRLLDITCNGILISMLGSCFHLVQLHATSMLHESKLNRFLVSHQDSHGHSKGHCWLNPILVSWHVRMFHSGLGRVRMRGIPWGSSHTKRKNWRSEVAEGSRYPDFGGEVKWSSHPVHRKGIRDNPCIFGLMKEQPLALLVDRHVLTQGRIRRYLIDSQHEMGDPMLWLCHG